MILKNFIVFEGIDGSGTTTQIKELSKKLEQKKAFFTCEPTDSEIGKFLRKILKGTEKVTPETISLLFAADRAEHLYSKNGIIEKCKNGAIVISDRYLFSSLAYQSHTCGKNLPEIVNSTFPLPEYLFYFSINPETALSRVLNRDGNNTEIFETLEYQKKTEREYKRVINEYKKMNTEMKIIEIDATLPVEKITKKIWTEIEQMPIIKM
jgi:dTMP kinase